MVEQERVGSAPRASSRFGFVAGLVLLAAVSGAVQFTVRLTTPLAWGDTGGDAQFWGRAAALLPFGTLSGRPPLYPGLIWAMSHATGLTFDQAASLLAGLAGVLIGPAFALAVAAITGRRAGLLAGAAVTLLPCLQASALEAEATTLYVLLRALGLLAGVAVARRGTLPRWLALGAVLAALSLTKEQGLLDLLLLGAIPLVTPRPGRWRAALGLLAVWLLLMAPALLLDLRQPDTAVLGKLFAPVLDQWRWLTEGTLPPPLTSASSGSPPQILAIQQAVQDPGLLGWRRASSALMNDAARMGSYGGLWLLAIPLALTVPWLGLKERWQRAALLLPLGELLVPLVFPSMARHTEIALLPVACILGVTAASPWRRGAARAALGTGSLLLLLFLGEQGVRWYRELYVPRALVIAESSADNRQTSRRLEARLPAGVQIYSEEAWIAFYLASSPRVEVSPVPPPNGLWLLHAGFTHFCPDQAQALLTASIVQPDRSMLAIPLSATGHNPVLSACRQSWAELNPGTTP